MAPAIGTAGDVVARARACVGARFRLHGRDPRFGLDCVGVATVAFARKVAGDYPLRLADEGEVARRIAAAGLRAATPEAGALLLMRAGAGQLHLGIRTDGGIVHADAGLRRVVETPGPPAWPVLGAWREEG